MLATFFALKRWYILILIKSIHTYICTKKTFELFFDIIYTCNYYKHLNEEIDPKNTEKHWKNFLNVLKEDR